MRSLDVSGADQHNRKKPRLQTEMPLADSLVAGSSAGGCGGNEESTGCLSMRVEDIVQHPLPGYESPVALSFSPDDRRVAFLYSPDGTLHRKAFTFDPAKRRQELLFAPPDGGGLEEGNLSAEERLRRERSRERGLGVTRYEWRARRSAAPSSRAGIVVPLPSGVYFQDLSGSEPVLMLESSSTSPIIDPHLSPDGTMIAYVRDDELQCTIHNSGFGDGETRQLTFGARESGKVHGLAEYIAQEEMERKMGFWWSPDYATKGRLVSQNSAIVWPKRGARCINPPNTVSKTKELQLPQLGLPVLSKTAEKTCTHPSSERRKKMQPMIP